MANLLKVAITIGDVDGIGPEVTMNALCEIGPIRGCQFIVFHSAIQPLPNLRKIKKLFKTSESHSVAEALWSKNTADIILIQDNQPPPAWVELCANLCMQGQLDGMVTGPLSKSLILKSGFKDIGHTEILARVSKTKNLFMGFVGSKFSVVLASGHIPLSKVSTAFNSDLLRQSIAASIRLKSGLHASLKKLPIALVGLNPHAGEGGILGREESWMRVIANEFKNEKIEGPLVPDAAFLPANWKKYCIYICPYHDQGLIPFKLAHGFDDGVHITLGLPFVRTSVDHGTAKDIFGKRKAQHGSMLQAISVALKLIKEQRK